MKLLPILLTVFAWLLGEGAVHVHLRTGRRYRILHRGKLKDSAMKHWLEVVTYFSVDDGGIYTTDLGRWSRAFVPLQELAA